MSKSTAAERKELAPGIYKMTFYTDDCRFTGPGQYALLSVKGISRTYQVCDYDSNRFTIVFRLSDEGSKELSELEYGSEIDSVTGLGNGFNVDEIPDNSVLAADSMGIAEMLELARALLTRGKKFKAVLGYKSKKDMYMVDSFRNICNELEVLTLDGSNGREGMPSDAVRSANYVCASGSVEMLKALAAKSENGQFSLSDVIAGTYDDDSSPLVPAGDRELSLRENGPVFDKNEISWDSIGRSRWSRSSY